MPSVKIAIDIRRMTEFGVGNTSVMSFELWDGSTTRPRILIGSPAKVKENPARCPALTFIPFHSPSRALGEELSGIREIVHSAWNAPGSHSEFVFRALARCLSLLMTVHDMLEHLFARAQQTGFWGHGTIDWTKRRTRREPARIFAVSNFTKIEIEKLFGIPRDGLRLSTTAIDEGLSSWTRHGLPIAS